MKVTVSEAGIGSSKFGRRDKQRMATGELSDRVAKVELESTSCMRGMTSLEQGLPA